jgi:hypothetical protein
MRTAHDPALRGRESWPNRTPETLDDELTTARAHGITALSPESSGFEALVTSGERFNWAILLDGTLRVSPSRLKTPSGVIRISHAILSDGQDVLATGEAAIGKYLDSTSGHFKPETYIIEPVIKAFARIGIRFAP